MCAESNVELKDTTTIVIGTMAGSASKPNFGSALPATLVPKICAPPANADMDGFFCAASNQGS